jgi:hypothetical protein
MVVYQVPSASAMICVAAWALTACLAIFGNLTPCCSRSITWSSATAKIADVRGRQALSDRLEVLVPESLVPDLAPDPSAGGAHEATSARTLCPADRG